MDNIQRRRCQAERMGGSDLESKLVRCAVVGLGQGMHDVNVITHHPRMSLVAVCDTDIERYEWLTGARPIEDATSDLAQQPGYRALVQSLRDRPDIKTVPYKPPYKELLKQNTTPPVVLVFPHHLHHHF